MSTRPVAENGLGLPIAAALANLAEFRRLARMLPEDNDAALVATMRVNSVRVLITSNPAHFVRFKPYVAVRSL